MSAQAPSSQVKSGRATHQQRLLRTMATQGANNRRGRNITEVNNVDSRNESAPSLSHSTMAFSQYSTAGPSIERLQRQSKSARRTSIRNAGAQSAVFGSPQRLASTNDVARRSWMRRGPDQGAFPPARRMGEHSAEAKSQRWPVSVSRAEPGCALMSPFPKICREFYRAFHP